MLAVLAVSTAAHANVEDPLYAPAKGHLYSKSSLSKADTTYVLQQKFGYGFTNRFVMDGFINYVDQDKDDGKDGFGALNIGGAYRLSAGYLITDVYVNNTSRYREFIEAVYAKETSSFDILLAKTTKEVTFIIQRGKGKKAQTITITIPVEFNFDGYIN